MVEKRGPKAGGFKSSAGPRSGGYERKPRAEGGDRKPYVKREGATGGYAKKSFGDGERKPYAKREGAGSGNYERKPRGEGSAAARRPYEGSNPRAEGERTYKPRAEGERASRPYTPRGDSDRPYTPRAPREGGYEKRPYTPRGEGAERKPYAKREGGSGGYEKRAYTPRDAGDRPARPYTPRGEGAEHKPYVKREGGSYDRKPREGGDRPYTPRAPREEGSYERKPYAGRRESFDRGDSTSAKFAEKRTIKRDRRPAEDSDTGLMRGDGWLIGYHAVLAALATGRRKVRAVWLLSEAQGELGDLIAKNPDWMVEIHSKPDFEKQFGEMVHQGVAALVGNLPQPSLPELLSEMKKSGAKLVVALDQITDPHNLGAIVRSCAAFGAQGVLVTEHRAAGLNATAAKVAAGAMEVVPVVEITNLAQSLEMMKEAGFTILGLAGDAETEIGEISEKGPVCLVLGSEGEGLRRLTRETCDKLVKIAISSKMESLNVSVATGVALSILTRK